MHNQVIVPEMEHKSHMYHILSRNLASLTFKQPFTQIFLISAREFPHITKFNL